MVLLTDTMVLSADNNKMPDHPTSGQSGTGLKKLLMLKLVRYQVKVTKSDIFLVRYWTKMTDAGMQMPALVFRLPMPTYGHMAGVQDHTAARNDKQLQRFIGFFEFLAKILTWLASILRQLTDVLHSSSIKDF
jgi:hypothetical protein